MIGKKLAHYEVLDLLGKGGMGEVYRARDTRLGRTVAIKVLPSHLSENPEIRERFEREARTISSLSHPNICALYDIGHDDGVDYLVMEYLEGETLADRVAREKLPLDEALRIAQQVADALARAHRNRVAHRDLKPGNIMLTRSGAKLLDFGLAKTAGAESEPASELTSLATEHAEHPLTAQGTILGTVQYMAPEQLDGKPADARTDIFALGAVLYEMVTGSRAFQGVGQASLIAAILKEQPRSIASHEPMTPPALDRLVRACMEKDPEDRIQTAHDVGLQLRWIREGGSEVGVPVPVRLRRRRRELYWMAVTVVFGIALAVLATITLVDRPEPARTVRLSLTVPAGAPYEYVSQPVLSPDGTRLVFAAREPGNRSSLWVRELDTEEARRLPGTDEARSPFWSPDGEMIAFFADDKLKKVSAAGGPPQVICDSDDDRGGSWGSDGIVFAGEDRQGLEWVSAAGGEPVHVTQVGDDEESHLWPSFLPDGQHFVYLGDAQYADGHFLKLGSVDGGTDKRLVNMISNVLFVPPDFVLFGRSGTLLAQRLDLDAHELIGEPVPLANDVHELAAHYYEFTASNDGALAYRSVSPQTALKVFDRNGREVRAIGEPARIEQVDVAPDGKRVAVDVLDAESRIADVWLLDMATGATSRFTTDSGSDGFAAWSSDGENIAFSSSRTGRWAVYLKSAGRIEKARKLAGAALGDVLDWSPDGQYLLVSHFPLGSEARRQATTNLWAIPLDSTQARIPLAQDIILDVKARFSPDGRWIAYDWSQFGRREIYVQSFPNPVTRQRVSVDGGRNPRWSADGSELFFHAPGSKIMVVDIATANGLNIGTPQFLFDVRDGFDDFAPLGAAQEFLVATHLVNRRTQPLTVVLNWQRAFEAR